MFGPIIELDNGKGLQITLRPFWSPEEIRPFAQGMSRMIVNRYLGRRIGASEIDEMEWFERTRNNGDSVAWAIEKDGRIVGSTALHDFDFETRDCTSGIMTIYPDEWGKGIATLAHHGRTWYAARRRNVSRIFSQVFGNDPKNGQGNEGSHDALYKIGYLVYAQRPYAVFIDGRYVRSNMLIWLNPEHHTIQSIREEEQFNESELVRVEAALNRAKETLKRAETYIKGYIY